MKTSEILHSALRQFRHNNSNEFVAGFDYVETIRIVTELQENYVKIEIIADNEIPAFAGYVNHKGGFNENKSPKILVNFKSMLIAAAEKNMDANGYKTFFAENVVHEMLHMVQDIFDQAFDEQEVEDAILQAREYLATR